MSIYKLESNLPTTTKIEDLNDMILEVNGKVAQGKFNKNEIDQIYTDTGMIRRFTREATVGHTATTYSNWTHLSAESGYSIWKYTVSTYLYNANNNLYLDDKLINFKGQAGAETATTFNSVFTFDGVSTYVDNTTEAGTEGGTSFDLMAATTNYVYVGSTSTFAGLKLELQTQGSNYTNTVQYFNGTWTTLTLGTNNYVDNTNSFTSDGTITWDIPTGWLSNSVNGVSRYWIRIATSTNPITTAKAYYIIPYSSVVSLLALSSGDIQDENWAWCSFGQNIYVTIRNSGASAYEGNYYITSSSTSTNKQNYFVSNHTYKLDYKSTTGSVATAGAAIGDVVYLSAGYTFNAAIANALAKRGVGILIDSGTVRYNPGLTLRVNTIGAGNIVAGDIVYLSATSAGKVTRTCPTATATTFIQQIGIALDVEESGGAVDILYLPNLAYRDDLYASSLTLFQATAGNPVLVLKTESSESGSDTDVNYTVIQNQATTTTASAAVLQSINIEPNSTILVHAKVIGKRLTGAGSDGDSCGYLITTVCRRIGYASATMVGSVDQDVIIESVSGWNATYAVSGNTVQLQVTGAVSTRMTWLATIEYMTLAS